MDAGAEGNVRDHASRAGSIIYLDNSMISLYKYCQKSGSHYSKKITKVYIDLLLGIGKVKESKCMKNIRLGSFDKTSTWLV